MIVRKVVDPESQLLTDEQRNLLNNIEKKSVEIDGDHPELTTEELMDRPGPGTA